MLVYNSQEYLTDLLEFARLRINFPDLDNHPEIDPVAKRLEEAFGLPFRDLIKEENLETGEEKVHHIQVAVEILRHHMMLNDIDTERADQQYLIAAYLGLLTQLGTSYEELRMVHAAGDENINEDREALASRLNLDNVDRLDELFIEPDELSEEKLEDIFGLASTKRDVFKSQPSQPRILKWKIDYLRKKWKEKPTPFLSNKETTLPLIDPDLIPESWLLNKDQIKEMDFVESDMVDDDLRSAAFDLWHSRAGKLADWVEEVQKKIEESLESESGLAKAFDRVIESFLGTVDLESTLKERDEGSQNPNQDNQTDLRISLSALRRLVRLRKLVAKGTLTDAEWSDVVHILVRNIKMKKTNAWRNEEKELGLFLSPDFFDIPSGTQNRDLPDWRAERRTRLQWKDALYARQRQWEATLQSTQAAMDNTSRKELYQLRDHLIEVISETEEKKDPGEVAEILTDRFMIDFKNRDKHKTTRLDQANEVVRGLVFALRMEQPIGRELSSGSDIGDWELAFSSGYTKEDFEQDWHWLGSYRTRRAAEFVKEFPENYLNPKLRKDEAPQPPTEAFSNLVKDLYRTPKLTTGTARGLARKYLNEIDKKHHSKIEKKLEEITNGRVQTFKLTEQLSEHEIVFRQKLSKKLLDEQDLKREYRDDDGEMITIEDPHLAPAWIQEIFYFVPVAIALQLQKTGEYLAALDWYQTVYAWQFAPGEREIYHGLNLESDFSRHPRITPDIWLRDQLNPHFFGRERKFAYTQFTIMSIVQCLLDYADSEFATETPDSIFRARTLYKTSLQMMELPQMNRSNPQVKSLIRHVQVNLEKLRNGQNIAGMERTSGQQMVAADGRTGLPVIGKSGQLVVTRSVSPPPTPYRYSVLIERAKELVTIAQQMESAFLSAQEKRDQEAYSRKQAEHDLNLSRSRVRLQDLRVTQADTNIDIAELQNDRTQIQHDTYQEWIDKGLNDHEKTMIDNYEKAREARQEAATLQWAASTASGWGNITNPASAIGWFASSTAGMFAAEAKTEAVRAETQAQIASVQSSHERRKQQWKLQKNLTQKDLEIATEKIDQAKQQLNIAEKEHFIATEQKEFAQATVDFLENKFTNRELYEYMSGVLNRIYGYFLQQATAMAQLAAHQLAFQRQSPPTTFIRSDYWQHPSESGSALVSANQNDDLKGVTGSARLLQDIYKLDQFSFETKERKLQLSQTFSLAHLFPFEFQKFSETGILSFSTPMELFDQGFPGHYLRLIKKVRVSVIALVPPTQGIRASLTASGNSRVVTKGSFFQTTIVRRDPEMIAFTSPREANGLFQLHAEDGMLLPFEGRGVDTHWMLEMPRSANSFDYHSIANVLLTIEYTALQSQQLRQQVIQEMDQSISNERSFSFRDDFPDQWYALNNPERSAEPMKVMWQTRRIDFPPNIERLKISQVLLYFSTTEGVSWNGMKIELTFKEKDQSDVVGGKASPVDGVISTRRASAGKWTSIPGKSLEGEWQLSVPDLEQMFLDEKIKDILFVITHEGRRPGWPDFG